MALHLRSRRVGSDEAVYQVTDLFSTLLARLAGREATVVPELHAAHRHDAIVRHIENVVAVLQGSSVGSLVRPSFFPFLSSRGVKWVYGRVSHAKHHVGGFISRFL